MDKGKLVNSILQWLQLAALGLIVYLAKNTYEENKENGRAVLLLTNQLKMIVEDNANAHTLFSGDIKELKTATKDLDHRTSYLEFIVSPPKK